jgi:hypothetical protein
MNAINIIAPYKYYGSWVFDDERVGLVKEPFVAGADTMIEALVANIPDAANGFVLIFSSLPLAVFRKYDGQIGDCDGQELRFCLRSSSHVWPSVLRGGLGCLNRISASISGTSAEVRLPSGEAAT